MISLRLPVQAHHYGVDPTGDFYRLLGFQTTDYGDVLITEMTSLAIELPLVEFSLSGPGTPEVTLGFRDYTLHLRGGQYLLKIGPTFTVATRAQFDQFLVESEW